MTNQGLEELALTTGSAPTDAHLAMNALLMRVLLEVARRRQDELPGLLESCQDQALLTVGATARAVHGTFTENIWRFGGRRVHELFLNGDRRSSRRKSIGVAEDTLVTVLHEACHLHAKVNGIDDTSRGGRYHNRRFAEIALQIGLEVEKDVAIGHRTPRLSSWARAEYADRLAELEAGLVLAREPQPRHQPDNSDEDDQLGDRVIMTGPAVATSKYVFASCQCLAGRGRRVSIRVAAGSWRVGVIQCGACGTAFEESLTGGRQTAPDPNLPTW